MKVLILRPVKLTDMQIAWLRFLAAPRGTLSPPGRNGPSLDVLKSHGLIKRVNGWGYRPSDTGYDVLKQLAEPGDDLMT